MLEKDDSFSEISHLKEEIKSKDIQQNSKKKDNNKSKDNSLKLYGNDINDKKPRYFGKTKSLLFIGETPFLIFGEDSNFYIN